MSLDQNRFDKYSFKTNNILEKTLSKIEKLDYKEEYLCNSYSPLVKKMKKGFISKSFNLKQYFLTNISQMYNRKTKETIINFDDNESAVLDYQRDLTYKEKDGEISYSFHNELISGQFLKNRNRTANYKRLSKVKYIESYNIGKKQYFLTWTLPSKFHKYKQKSIIKKDERHYEDFEQLIENPNYEFELNFEKGVIDGLEILNKIHRFFYKSLKAKVEYKTNKIKKILPLRKLKLGKLRKENQELKKDKIKNNELMIINIKKRVKLLLQIECDKDTIANAEEYYNIDFLKMIEPHKSLTPHQHLLLWQHKKFDKLFKNARKATIEKFELNSEFQDVEIVSHAKASSYIAKYLIKGIEVERNEDGELDDKNTKDEENFFEIYKQHFGKHTRFFTTSNFKTKGLTQKKIDIMYKYLKENRPNMLTAMKNTSRPMYRYFETLYKKGMFKFEEKENNSQEFEEYHFKKPDEVNKDFKNNIEKALENGELSYTLENENINGDINKIEVKEIYNISTKNKYYAIKDITIKPYFKINNAYIEEKFEELKQQVIDEAETKLLDIYTNKFQAKKVIDNVYVNYDLNDYKKMLKSQFNGDLEALKTVSNKTESRAKELLIEDINNQMISKDNPYLEQSKSKIIKKAYFKDSFNPKNQDYKLIYEADQYVKAEIDIDYFVKVANNHGFSIDHSYYERNYVNHKNKHKEALKTEPTESEVNNQKKLIEELRPKTEEENLSYFDSLFEDNVLPKFENEELNNITINVENYEFATNLDTSKSEYFEDKSEVLFSNNEYLISYTKQFTEEEKLSRQTDINFKETRKYFSDIEIKNMINKTITFKNIKKIFSPLYEREIFVTREMEIA